MKHKGMAKRLKVVGVLGASLALAMTVAPSTATPAGGKLQRHGSDTAASPVRSCASLANLHLPNTTVDSVALVPANGTISAEHCEVQLTVASSPAAVDIQVGISLPTTWKGRFLGIGGSGYSAGDPAQPCFVWQVPTDECALEYGYVTAQTNAGTSPDVEAGDFALNSDNSLNWPLIRSAGYSGIHQMTVTAKKMMKAYYGTGPRYSYFKGLSGGGRNALMEAQRYPTDYDGIMAGAPVINWTRYIPSMVWPQFVMNWADTFIPQSTFVAVNDAVKAACDDLDNVHDNIIANWQDCDFDARTLIGGVVTAEEADVINKIWEGPRDTNGEFLWYGLTRGADFDILAGTVTAPDGTTTPAANLIGVNWYKNFLAQNPDLDWRTITHDQFVSYFHQSVDQFGDAWSAANPDLSAFRNAGGKLIITHGMSDQGISPNETIDYYNRVTQAVGGVNKVEKFARVFFAAGAGHGTSLIGPSPAGSLNSAPTPGGELAAVVDWVENNKAPKQLLGVTHPDQPYGNTYGDVEMTRPICVYPLVARYKGHGSTNVAKNFVCSKKF